MIDLDLGFSLWLRNISCRLARINAPERSTPEGKQAKYWLETQVLLDAPSCRVRTHKPGRDYEKYGRYLAELYVWLETGQDWVCVNDWLVAEGLAEVWNTK